MLSLFWKPTMLIGIGAIAALIRWNKIHSSYYPFLILIIVGFISEIVSNLLTVNGYHNYVSTNIYCLFEAVIILLFLKNFGVFPNKMFFRGLIFFYTIFWFWETLIFSSINTYNSLFILFYSFINVILSIHLLNKILIEEREALLKNALFLVLVGFIIYYTYSIVIEVFWIYGGSNRFLGQLYSIMRYVNAFIQLLYAFAILIMPSRQRFSLQY